MHTSFILSLICLFGNLLGIDLHNFPNFFNFYYSSSQNKLTVFNYSNQTIVVKSPSDETCNNTSSNDTGIYTFDVKEYSTNDHCIGYGMGASVYLYNCSYIIQHDTANLTFHLIEMIYKLNNNNYVLKLPEHDYHSYYENEPYYIFPGVIKNHFAYVYCPNYLCKEESVFHLNDEFRSDFSFSLRVTEELKRNFNLSLEQVYIIERNKENNDIDQIVYLAEVSKYINSNGYDYNLNLKELPENNFDLYLIYNLHGANSATIEGIQLNRNDKVTVVIKDINVPGNKASYNNNTNYVILIMSVVLASMMLTLMTFFFRLVMIKVQETKKNN